MLTKIDFCVTAAVRTFDVSVRTDELTILEVFSFAYMAILMHCELFPIRDTRRRMTICSKLCLAAYVGRAFGVDVCE